MIQFAAIKAFINPTTGLIALSVVLGLGIGWQEIRVQGLRADLAIEKQERADENTARALAVVADLKKINELKAQHAIAQQGLTDDYQKKLAAAAARHAGDLQRAERMRGNAVTYTTSTQRADGTDAASCIRDRDRLVALRPSLAEIGSLLAEARTTIVRRDSEVAILKGQVTADRAACASRNSERGSSGPAQSPG